MVLDLACLVVHEIAEENVTTRVELERPVARLADGKALTSPMKAPSGSWVSSTVPSSASGRPSIEFAFTTTSSCSSSPSLIASKWIVPLATVSVSGVTSHSLSVV